VPRMATLRTLVCAWLPIVLIALGFPNVISDTHYGFDSSFFAQEIALIGETNPYAYA